MPNKAENLRSNRIRVIDLVEASGIDTSDWGNFKKGPMHAASNPKYCYEWSFVDPQTPPKIVVLNLWESDMSLKEGVPTHRINFRDYIGKSAKPVWINRAARMENAVRLAFERHLSVRVIVNIGKRRDRSDPNAAASQVAERRLDPVNWHVSFYDAKKHECEIRRGSPTRFVDQFELDQTAVAEASAVGSVQKLVTQLQRSREVRGRVLSRAKGFCELCGQRGFLLRSGETYLETHHIVPLSENGPDSEANVIALCPNHHREAHYGAEAEIFRVRLVEIVSDKRR